MTTGGAAKTVLGAVVVFVTTNADDLVLLAAFFADDRFRPSAIVGGQLLGIGILTAVAAAAAFGAMTLPPAWVALVGVVPLALGLHGLLALRRHDDDDDDARPTSGRTSQVLAVAATTIANGGDNLGVYVPLFASRPSAILGYVGVFTAMTFGWCLLGWWLVRNRTAGVHVRRWARVALPIVLVIVGIDVLAGALPLVSR